MNTHELDPAHYFTVPGLTFDTMLKYTKMNIELLQDYDMILMKEHGIRGDANNLYGQAMSMYLPYGGFEWVNSPDCVSILDLRDDDEIGYLFELDIIYPQELHHIHDNLPFLPETIVPPLIVLPDDLLIGTKMDSKSAWITNGTLLCLSTFENLILVSFLGNSTLKNRNRYVLHYRNLIQAIKHGLKLEKIHRALKFNQSPWLSSYIEYNTELRKGASNDFEKDFYKLLNNAVFGKTMENIRNRQDIQLVTDSKKLMKLIAKPNFIDRTIYNENIAAVHMNKSRILFNKPIYIGMCILDLSKIVMYHFHYDVMMKRYPTNTLKMMYTDTDSFIYRILTDDVYEDMKNMNQFRL
nr:uncharacterized protein LOC112211158 [Halyomorpha halys]